MTYLYDIKNIKNTLLTDFQGQIKHPVSPRTCQRWARFKISDIANNVMSVVLQHTLQSFSLFAVRSLLLNVLPRLCFYCLFTCNEQ